MIKVISFALMGIFNSFSHIYIWSILTGKKINYNDKNFYLKEVLFSIILLINFFMVNGFVRIVTLIFILILFSNLIFKSDIKESLLMSFLSEILMIVSELLFVMIINIICSSTVNELVNGFSGTLLANLVVSGLAIMLSKIPIWRYLYNLLISSFKNIADLKIVIIIVVALISFNLIFGFLYQKVNLTYMLIINAIISMIYIFICIRFVSAESKYFKINDKYNNTLNSLKEYEDILDVYRVSSHENKNQLLMIRNMILKEEKGIPEYIDKIIDNKIKDDEKLMFDTNKIPAGGLRAVVYSKLLVMKDEKIDFKLIVDRKVRTVELIELGEDLMLDVCRVTGVFLDNAIEEVKNKDNKKIIVELFTDEDKLCIKISNNFSGSINIEKMYDKGYTTKSNGHGYGLSLVKEILDKNNKLSNLTSVEKDMFTQLLEIKIK